MLVTIQAGGGANLECTAMAAAAAVAAAFRTR
jgi:hypothetical protein